MAYSTHTVDLNSTALNYLATAAQTAGWAVLVNGVDNGAAPGSGDKHREYVVIIDNGTSIFGFAFSDSTDGANLRVYAMDSYSALETIDDQAGSTYIYGNYYRTPAGRVHIFAKLNYVYFIVESTTGSYRHAGVGELIKNDAYPGGAFMTTHRSNTTYNRHNRPFQSDATYDSESVDNMAILAGGDGSGEVWRFNRGNRNFPTKCYGGIGGTALTQNLVNASDNQFNNESILIPVYCSIEREGNDFDSPVGYPPDVRAVNIRYVEDKQVVNLGADDWVVFACGERATSNSAFASGYTGLAYLTE